MRKRVTCATIFRASEDLKMEMNMKPLGGDGGLLINWLLINEKKKHIKTLKGEPLKLGLFQKFMLDNAQKFHLCE